MPTILDQHLYELKKNAANLKLAHDLIIVHEKFIKKLEEVNNIINKKVGPKGDKGDSIPGPRGPQGVPGKDGINGTSINFNEVIATILSKIPSPKDGRDGKDAKITGEHINKIVDKVSRKIPEVKTVDALSVIEQIQNMPEGKRLSSKHIDGLEQTLSAFRTQMSRGYLHGGGDTVKAGTGISITVGANGVKTINATGTSNSGYQDPTSGALNQPTFTWAIAPKAIVVDGETLKKVEQGGTVNWTGTTTTVMTVWPTQSIFAVA